MDLVRNVLLAVEASTLPNLGNLFVTLGTGKHSITDPVCYHVNMLIEEVSFLKGIDSKTYVGPD